MSLLHGRYELVRPLGSGGAGQTWVATDTTTGEQVTIKELRADLRGDFRELLEREARMLGQIRHPQIPRFVEAFTEEVRLVPRLHLVLSYVDGVPLSEELTTRRLTQEEALATLVDLLGIVGWLHQLAPPVVHRDIKPSNVIRRPDGSLALIDFGLATDAVDRTFQHTMAAGTVGYQAPEQIAGEPSAASDVYSVGVVALELFTRASPRELLSGHTLRWEGRAAHLPRSLRRWLSRALAPEAADRFPDGRAARDALPRRLDDDAEPELPAAPAPHRRRSVLLTGLSASLAVSALTVASTGVLISAVVLVMGAKHLALVLGVTGVVFAAPPLMAALALGRVRQVGPHELLVVQRLGRLLPPQRAGRRLLIPFVDREAWLPLDGGPIDVNPTNLWTHDGRSVRLRATARVRVRTGATHLDAAVQRFAGRAEDIPTTARAALEDALRGAVHDLRYAEVLQKPSTALEDAVLDRTDRDLAALGLRLEDLTVREVAHDVSAVSKGKVGTPQPPRAPPTPTTATIPDLVPRWWVERPDGAVEGPLPEVVVEDLLYDGALTLDSPVWSHEGAQAPVRQGAGALPLRRWRPWLAGISQRTPDPARLAELQEAVKTPGYASWRRIRQICEGRIDADTMREVYLPVLGADLARWPDRRRSLDWSTADDVFRLQGSPAELELVRTVRLTRLFEDDNVAYRGLLALHRRTRIRVLDVSSDADDTWRLGAARLAELVRAPQLAAVRTLRLGHAGLDAASLHSLRDASFASGLRELDLSHNAIGGGVASLLALPACSGLRALTLTGAGLVAEDVAAIACSGLPLEALALDENPALSDEALLPLAEASFAGTLRRLSVGGTTSPLGGVLATLGSRGVRLHALTVKGSPLGDIGSALPLLEAVRALVLEDVEDLDDEDADAIAAAGLVSLEGLDLEGSRVSARGLRALLGSLPGLRRMTARRTRIRDADALVDAAPLRRHLGSLDLSGNPIGAATLSALTALGLTLDELRVEDCGLTADALRPLLDGALFGPNEESCFMDLGKNPIGDGGVAALVGSPLLARLIGLDLSGCGLTDAGARILAAAPEPLPLKYLELDDNDITDAGHQALLASDTLSTDLRESLALAARLR